MPPRKAKEDISTADALRRAAEELIKYSRQPNLHGYKPHDKQIKFHSSPKKRRLYIGGNRSGKSTGGVIEDIWWCTGTHPFRETPPPPVHGRVIGVDFLNGVSKILIPAFKRWIPPSVLEGGEWDKAYSKELRTLSFANGSTIEFMSYDQDLDKFAGTSRHFIHFDEEPPEAIWTENMARLIDTGGSVWLTMTPVEGMSWVYDLLYEPGKQGSPLIDVIEISMEENPHLAQAEVKEFLDSLTPEERLARGEGKFVQMGGLIYKHFDPMPGGTHVIDREDYLPPKDWTWGLSLDHGFNNPTAVLWHGISPDGQVITFDEWYQSGLTVDKHAEEILRRFKRHGRRPDLFIADPSIRNTDPITGTSIWQEYIKYGIPFQFGNNDVKAGIIRTARFMTVPTGKDSTKPLWQVTRNCERLRWELGRYRWKTYASKKTITQNNLMEEPHKKDDHACDSLRYFIMSRPDLTAGVNHSGPSLADHLRDYGMDIGNVGNVPLVGARSVSPQGEYVQVEWMDGSDELGGVW